MDNGNSDRARLDFANEALERAQAKVNDLTGQMKTELTALQVATDKYTAAATRHYAMLAEIDRLRLHVKDNIIYYMQAIWTHEPADQRYFRIYNLDVPVFERQRRPWMPCSPPPCRMRRTRETCSPLPTLHTSLTTSRFPSRRLSEETRKLHQVADIDTLIGFKGNYMIFPLIDFDNYMAWYLIHNYVDFDPTSGLVPVRSRPRRGLTPSDSRDGHGGHQRTGSGRPSRRTKTSSRTSWLRLLSNETEQMVIVPSDQLYIEALPGTHPILEDFKLMHRALDVKKVQAEVRHAELENLRLAARLANGEYGDPDVEKKIVIEGNTDKIAIQPDGG